MVPNRSPAASADASRGAFSSACLGWSNTTKAAEIRAAERTLSLITPPYRPPAVPFASRPRFSSPPVAAASPGTRGSPRTPAARAAIGTDHVRGVIRPGGRRQHRAAEPVVVLCCPHSLISVTVRAPETTAQAQISSRQTRGYHRPRRERGSGRRRRWARRRPVSCGCRGPDFARTAGIGEDGATGTGPRCDQMA